MPTDTAALLALIAELYSNLGRANARVAELEQILSSFGPTTDPQQP